VIAVEPIDVQLTMPSQCIADARALRRSLDASRLPTGGEIRFPDSPHRRAHFSRSLGLAAIILCEGLLITTLLVQLSRRRRAERALQNYMIDATHASRLVIAGELTASIAHEIKQPLAAILCNAEAAESLLQSDRDVRKLLSPILADIRRDDLRASEVTRRLRYFLAKHEVERKAMDLNATVADVCALLESEAEHRGVRLDLREDSVARIEGDRIQIQQVLINLMMNAMDAVKDVSEERRTIIVSVTSSGWRPTVKVRDFGHGIRAGEVPKVFKSFYTSKPTGMGLGLSIARAIVESHEGYIEVTSRWGEGSEFSVSFPSFRSTSREPDSLKVP
jgi:C4-dicarboxylate-specific signal transduction histidine kinase